MISSLVISVYALNLKEEDCAKENISSDISTTSSAEFVSEKINKISLFIETLSVPEVDDSPEEENIVSIVELGVQARACLSSETNEKAEEEAKAAQKSKSRNIIRMDYSNKGPIEGNVFYLPECPLSADLQQYIYDLAIEFDIPVDMMFTIPKHESGYNPYAVSATNDHGLYQFNKCNHEGYSRKCKTENDPYNPYISALWAATMISSYLRQFENQYDDYSMVIDRTLSCYNGGPRAYLIEGYLSRYDACHTEVAQWMINAGYEHLIKAW